MGRHPAFSAISRIRTAPSESCFSFLPAPAPEGIISTSFSPAEAAALKKRLDPGIPAVGVFVDEPPASVAALLNTGTIDLAQLHGSEDEAYIRLLRSLTDKPIIQAFRLDRRAASRRSGAFRFTSMSSKAWVNW